MLVQMIFTAVHVNTDWPRVLLLIREISLQTCLVQSVAICPWKSCFYVKNYVLFLNKKRASWPYLYKPPCMKKKKKVNMIHQRMAQQRKESHTNKFRCMVFSIFHLWKPHLCRQRQQTPSTGHTWPPSPRPCSTVGGSARCRSIDSVRLRQSTAPPSDRPAHPCHR